MDSQSTVARGDTQSTFARGDTQGTLSRGDTQGTLSRGDTQGSMDMDLDSLDLPQLLYYTYFKNDRSAAETTEMKTFLDWVSEAWRPSHEGVVDAVAMQQCLRERLPTLSWKDSGIHVVTAVNDAWRALSEMDAAETKFNRFYGSIDKSVKDMKAKIQKQILQADVMQQKLARCDTWANNKIEELKADLGPIRATTTKTIFEATVRLASLFDDFKSQMPAPGLGQAPASDDDIEMELAMQMDMMELDGEPIAPQATEATEAAPQAPVAAPVQIQATPPKAGFQLCFSVCTRNPTPVLDNPASAGSGDG